MPPPGAKTKPLSPAPIRSIITWTDSGAEWPEGNVEKSNHWSFQPIARPRPSAVKNEAWARGAINRFVLARLEARGIAPAPETDLWTLIKRLTYDVT
jgi:hypothetical protein